MKKISLMIIMAFLLTLDSYASRYEVFRVKGSVMIENGGKWDAVSPRTPVEGSSRLKIESGATIGIKDNDSKSIYYGSGPDEISVVRLIMAAKKGMQSKTSTIAKTLGRAVISDTPRRRAVLGVANRGGAHSVSGNDEDNEIKAGSLEYFIKTLARGEVAENTGFPYDVKGEIIVDPDSVASYEIAFSSLPPSYTDISGNDDFYFLNVLKIIDGEVPRLIFQSGVGGENISIGTGDVIKVDWFPTVFDPQARYLLFVSDTPYRSELLQNTMNFIWNGKINTETGLPLDKELRQSSVWVFEIFVKTPGVLPGISPAA